MKPISLYSTQLAKTDASESGTPRGEAGLVPATGATVPSTEIAEFLAKQHPRKMDLEAVRRLRSRGLSLDVKTRNLFPTGPNGENLPMRSLAIAATCWTSKPLGEIDLDEAIAEFDRFMTPPPEATIAKWLTQLQVMTKSRKRDDQDMDLLLETYVQQLRTYPADVIRHALFGERWTWWPTWAELADVVEPLASHRRLMRDALLCPDTPDSSETKSDDELAAERQRIREIGEKAIAELKADMPEHKPKPLWTPDEAKRMREATKPDVELARIRSKKFNGLRLTEKEEIRLQELLAWEREALK